jgi:S-adenosylhomocysteine hydrolase
MVCLKVERKAAATAVPMAQSKADLKAASMDSLSAHKKAASTAG